MSNAHNDVDFKYFEGRNWPKKEVNRFFDHIPLKYNFFIFGSFDFLEPIDVQFNLRPHVTLTLEQTQSIRIAIRQWCEAQFDDFHYDQMQGQSMFAFVEKAHALQFKLYWG